MKNKFVEGIIKASKNEYAGNLKTCEIYNERFYVDTGNYILNALISGDMFKGIPSGMIVQWAGEKSTGKSFLTTNVVLHHLKSGPDHMVLFFETEFALNSQKILENLTEDEAERFMLFPCRTIEEIKYQFNSILEYLKKNREELKNKKIVATIDSLGMPASKKEKEEATDEDNKKDMTRAQAIKSLFRTIVMDLGILGIPVNVVNHQYSTMDQWNPKEESGGTGIAFANSVTLVLTKKKLKEKQDGKEVQVGTSFIITPKKSRIVAENISTIEIYSKFKIGMDRYSGLWEFLKNHKLIESKPNGPIGGSTIILPELGLSWDSKDIVKMSAEEFWTDELIAYCNKKFQEMFVLESVVNNKKRPSIPVSEESQEEKVKLNINPPKPPMKKSSEDNQNLSQSKKVSLLWKKG